MNKTEWVSGALDALDDRYITEAADMMATAHPRHAMRRLVSLAAALVLAVGVGVPALAATNDAFNAQLYRVFPGLAQALRPVNLSCEDNGIRMEVISAQVEGGTARVYLALQDLEGDRIDGTVDLFDSYQMDLPSGLIAGHCEQVAYDPDTRTATFLATLEGWDALKLSDKVTFSLDCFLSHKKTTSCELMTFVPAALEEGEAWAEPVLRGGGGTDPQEMDMLAPAETPVCEPVPGVTLVSVQYLNGLLHVQHRYQDIKHTDNHGWPVVLDPDGQEIPGSYRQSAWDAERCDSYEDDVYAIPRDDTRAYTLLAEYITSDALVCGNWRVTFPVQ